MDEMSINRIGLPHAWAWPGRPITVMLLPGTAAVLPGTDVEVCWDLGTNAKLVRRRTRVPGLVLLVRHLAHQPMEHWTSMEPPTASASSRIPRAAYGAPPWEQANGDASVEQYGVHDVAVGTCPVPATHQPAAAGSYLMTPAGQWRTRNQQSGWRR